MVARRMSHRHASEPRGVNKTAQVKRRDADLLKKEKEAAARKERRRVAALAKAADEQARLDARIRNEEAQTAVPANGTLTLSAPRKTAQPKPVKGARPETITAAQLATALDEVSPEIQAKRNLWLLSDARHLMRQGYALENVMARTGWPAEMLEDVKAGAW